MRVPVSLLLFTAAVACAADSPFAKLTSDDLGRGKRLFEAQCSVCHGITGNGGKGANLAVAKFKRAPDDAALLEVVRNGIPDSEMPAAWWMSDGESLQVAYYVRSLGRVASTIRVAGNTGAGKEVFFGKGGCSGCHIANGTGGTMGPELTEIGAKRSPMYLREALLQPARTVPEGFVMVKVIGRDGKETRGIRINEDTFSIQMRDTAGRFLSFRKADVRGVFKEFGQTPMPSYQGKLSDPELDNVVAYMVSLRGEK